VLRRYEPDHLLLKAAWADARTRMTDVGRLAACSTAPQGRCSTSTLDRVSPMAVPVLVIIGRERTATGTVDALC
jgi:ATP-dependent Lhr-like helicase